MDWKQPRQNDRNNNILKTLTGFGPKQPPFEDTSLFEGIFYKAICEMKG